MWLKTFLRLFDIKIFQQISKFSRKKSYLFVDFMVFGMKISRDFPISHKKIIPIYRFSGFWDDFSSLISQFPTKSHTYLPVSWLLVWLFTRFSNFPQKNHTYLALFSFSVWFSKYKFHHRETGWGGKRKRSSEPFSRRTDRGIRKDAESEAASRVRSSSGWPCVAGAPTEVASPCHRDLEPVRVQLDSNAKKEISIWISLFCYRARDGTRMS